MPLKNKISKKQQSKSNTARRQTRFSFKHFIIYGKIFIILLIIGAMGFYSKKNYKKFITPFENYYYSQTSKFGLTLQNVYLEGQNYTNTKTLMDVLQLKIGQPILSISINKLKQQLEQTNWVKYAVVERSFPNTLYIGIIEKTPIALWQNGGKFFLIDETGAIINETNLKKFSNFIVLIGEDAPLYAKALLEIITKDKSLFEKISYATRIGERRWNVKFQNGLEIKLPEENPEAAWNYVIDLYNKKNLFGKSISNIDLRIANKLYIK
ncbi:MAG: cell division protein FtsQ/DivIB [Alphaproteobacteria bacterium]